jgi:hypothetical protein
MALTIASCMRRASRRHGKLRQKVITSSSSTRDRSGETENGPRSAPPEHAREYRKSGHHVRISRVSIVETWLHTVRSGLCLTTWSCIHLITTTHGSHYRLRHNLFSHAEFRGWGPVSLPQKNSRALKLSRLRERSRSLSDASTGIS